MWGGSLARAPAQQQAGQQGAGEEENVGLELGAHDTANIRIFAALRKPEKGGISGAAPRYQACGGVLGPGRLRLNMPSSHSTSPESA